MKTRRKSIAALLMLLAGFILLVGGLFIALQPNEFQAVARIVIEQPDKDSHYLTGYDPYFILTEIQVMQSHAILGKVIDSRGLAEAWSKKCNFGRRLSDAQVEQMLKQKLDIRQIRQVRTSRFVEIRVSDEDPREAAGLANSIAGAYRESKAEESRELSVRGFEQMQEKMNEQLRDQDARVQALQEKLEEQKRELNISDETTASNLPAAAPYFATKAGLEAARTSRDNMRQTLNRLPVDFQLPRVELVSIVDSATVPTRPIPPDRPLGIAMVIAGFALIIGAIVALKAPNGGPLSLSQGKR